MIKQKCHLIFGGTFVLPCLAPCIHCDYNVYDCAELDKTAFCQGIYLCR